MRLHTRTKKDNRLVAYGFENIIGQDFFVQVMLLPGETNPSQLGRDWEEEMLHNWSTLAYMGEEKVDREFLIKFLEEECVAVHQEFLWAISNF